MKNTLKDIFEFPHTKLFFILLLSGFISLLLSILFNIHELEYVSSFLANLSAGLFTGLVICIVAGSKTSYLQNIEEKRDWFFHLHEKILDFRNQWYSYTTAKFDNHDDEHDFVYDMICYLSWVIQEIQQSQFDKTRSFNGYELITNHYNYNVDEQSKKLLDLRDHILYEDWNKQDILDRIKPLNHEIMLLNGKLMDSIKEINIKTSKCNKSLI